MAQTSTEPAEQALPDGDGTEAAPLGPKHELVTTSAALIQRAPLPRGLAPYVLSDDEIRRTFRLASALATSGMFKDAQQAEVAFAKILIGQDLGISATRALAGLDIVKGNVQMRGVLLLSFVRQSRTYDYKIIELDGETEMPGKTPAEIEAKQRATLRFFEVHPDGTKEALVPDVTFTMAMARKQGNVKDGSAWHSARRNMLLWRAASDGVKFHCPDLLGGIPVYTEADSFPEPARLGEGQGDGNAVGIDLGPDVEAVIARATALGHDALADRATIEMVLGDQPPAKVVEWVKAGHAELDRLEHGDEEVTDAVVVEPQEGHESPAAPQAPDGTFEAASDPQAPAAAPEASESAPDPERIAALRRRVSQLLDDADMHDARGDERAAADARDEAAHREAEIEAATDPAQERMVI